MSGRECEGGEAETRQRVDAFVARHFTWPGTLRLHRAALGADILRAPANVVLSPVLLLVRVAGWVCNRLRLSGAAGWLARRRILLRTDVAARVEAAVLAELLDVPLPVGAVPRDREGLARAILAAPPFAAAIRRSGSVSGAEAMVEGVMQAVADYTAVRPAMSEIATALLTLAVGAVAFQAVTPGMVSMTPGVAEAVARSLAVGEFPLGERLGAVWYGVFPVGPSPAVVLVTAAGLVALGSTVAAFAGVVTDPLQARVGLHRRRLMRLMARIEAVTAGAAPGSEIPAEHLAVRAVDLWDVALSVLRVFRG